MISSSSANSSITKVELVSLRDPCFISLLRSFKSMLKTSVGPSGNSKLLISGGGYTQLSSSSLQVIQHYDQLNNPIIQFIAQIMKGQPDFGLYCGIVIASSLENLLTFQNVDRFTRNQSIKIINTLVKNCEKVFENYNLRIKVNFDSILDFIPLVRTVIGSKFSGFLTTGSLKELGLEIIKSFIYTLDVDRMTVGKVIIHVYSGNAEFKFYPGIIYRLTEDDVWVSKIAEKEREPGNMIKTLLFTTALDCESENDINVIDFKQSRMNKIFVILEKAIELNVRLIVCQKVVLSEIIMFVRRKSVMILERLGTNLASQFEQISGSFPISDIDRISSNEVSSMIGTIDEVNTSVFDSNLYLIMCRQSTNVATLLLKTPSLAGPQQIKILVEQALRSLRALVVDPTICPGAGCFEATLFVRLQELCKLEIPSCDLKWLFNVLLEASGCPLPVWVDSHYNHAWISEEQAKCNCHLVSRSAVLNNGGTFCKSDEMCFGDLNHVTNRCQPIEITSDAIVDSFVHKRSSLFVALESCVNLLNIGTIVYRNHVE